MPNHIHMIIAIDGGSERATARVAPTVGSIVGGYKSIISNAWLVKCKENDVFMGHVWQRSYHDHIIRGEEEYQKIRHYINENPAIWTNDLYYPK